MNNLITALREYEMDFEMVDGTLTIMRSGLDDAIIIEGPTDETIEVNNKVVDAILFHDLITRYPNVMELF